MPAEAGLYGRYLPGRLSFRQPFDIGFSRSADGVFHFAVFHLNNELANNEQVAADVLGVVFVSVASNNGCVAHRFAFRGLLARRCDSRVRIIDYFDLEVKRIQ